MPQAPQRARNALMMAKPPVTQQRDANRHEILHADQVLSYSLAQAYANAMSKRNATMVTAAKRRSAIRVQLLSWPARRDASWMQTFPHHFPQAHSPATSARD